MANTYGFTGEQQFNEVDSLVYLWARYYSPSVGRFISQDPLGYFDSMNMYCYVLNNPINLFDPYGLSLTNIGIGVIGGDNSFGNFIGCMAKCIEENHGGDIVHLIGIGGARLPKKWPLPGAPKTTSIWTKCPGIAPGVGKLIGRAFIPITLISGGHAAYVEAICTYSCLQGD
ncbi:MAG: RHS repeat-associated core domain-containing protein [Phycisphaerales bacterium]